MDHPENATENFYTVLGVPSDVDAVALKQAWRSLVARHHPDRFPGDSAKAAIFLRVQEAYRVLSDPQLRARYDASLLPPGIAGALQPIEPGFPSRPGPPWGLRLALTEAQSHASSAFLRFLWASASRLPWQSLVRIRTLLTALVVGAVVVAWQVSATRSRPVVLPAGPSGGAPGSAVRPLPASGRPEFPATPARIHQYAGLPALPTSQRISVDLSPQALTAAPEHKASARANPPQTPEPQLPLLPGLGYSLAGSVPGPLSIPPALGSIPPQAPSADSMASSRMAVPGQADSPASVPAPAPYEVARFLAGCASQQGTRIWVGVATVRGTAGSLSWRSWDAVPGDATGATAFALQRISESSAQPLTRQHPDPEALGATLHHAPGSFSRLSLNLAGSQAPPCSEWHLAPLSGPAVQPGQALAASISLAGRWLRPESRGNSSDDPFPLESMEILIGQDGERWHGRMRSSHRVNSSALPPGTRLSVLPPSLVQFVFDAPVDGFAGEFSWRLEGYGGGTLTVAPVSPTALAIRWRAGLVEPGALRLTGAAALLRRR